MKNLKKKAAAFVGVVAALCLTIGTLAVFTDRFQAQTTATAGTLDIVLSESWTADNAALAQAYKPGTALKLNYTLSNTGNMSADVRETFALTFGKAISENAHEFDLYPASAVTVDASGNVTAINGTALTPTFSTDKKVLTYSLDQYMLDADGGNTDSRTFTYYVVFNTNVDNSFQDVSVAIDYLAQALQHENSGAKTWADARVVSESITFGGQEINVVREAD